VITEISLRAIAGVPVEFEHVEAEIKRIFREILYHPILKLLNFTELAPKIMANASKTPLQDALASGRVTFSRGMFLGRFSAAVSKELKAIGATWDRKALGFRLPLAEVPYAVRGAISASTARFNKRLAQVDALLRKNLPEEISGMVQVSELFDRSLWRVDKAVADTLKGITVPPQLTPERRRKIADEWQNNLQLWIKDFTAEEIVSLRKSVEKTVYSGSRRDAVIRSIQKSYGVSARKAKFLARQETNLLLTKFKESRYIDSGVHEYTWRCVVGSKNHPVRPSHKILDGKTFRWDDPPITTEPGQPVRRNNPGQDFECRCAAIPKVTFTAK